MINCIAYCSRLLCVLLLLYHATGSSQIPPVSVNLQMMVMIMITNTLRGAIARVRRRTEVGGPTPSPSWSWTWASTRYRRPHQATQPICKCDAAGGYAGFAVATTTGSEIGEAGEEEAGDGGRSPQPSSVQMSMSAPAAAAASAAAAHTKELASNLNSAAKNMNKKSVAALSNMKTAMNAKVAAARVKVRQGLHVGRRGSSTGANADAESNADIGDGDLVDGNNGVAKGAGETGKVAPTVAALASEKSNFFDEDDSDTSSIRSPAPTPTTASGRSAGNATSAGAGTDNVSVSLATALDAASSNTHKFGCSRDRPSSSPQQQQRLQQSGNEGGNASSTSKGANPKADGEGEGDDGEEGLDKFAVPDTEESRFEMGFEEDNIRDDMSDCSEFREATSDFGDGFSDFGGGGGGGGGAQQQQGRRRSFFSRAISGATSAQP